jgi:hypothetical protein
MRGRQLRRATSALGSSKEQPLEAKLEIGAVRARAALAGCLVTAAAGCAGEGKREENVAPAPTASASVSEEVPVERCPVPSMADLYAGLLPPSPEGPLFTSACVTAKHDAIIVLGCPALADGTPSRCQIARADMALALRDAGYGDRFIVSGGAVHTPHVEAETLRDLLVERGVDAAAIELEPQARHTDENLHYSSLVMSARGWRSALVVSDFSGHLLFTGVCDSNCCVQQGRLTVVRLPPAGIIAGHYVLYPHAEPVSDAECAAIRAPWKAMCINLERRNACKGRLRP